MTDEERIAELKLTFLSKGWEVFIENMEETEQALNTVDGCSDLSFRQGQLATVRAVLAYENTVELAEADNDVV